MGSRCTIGAEVEVYNFAPVVLEDDATVSQYTYICTASHDYTGPAMKLTFRPISIGPKAWVAAGSFIGPGVVIGEGAVVGARSVVTRDVRPWMIVAGNPAREIKPRIYSGR
jgi:putative colanic acid biosynthesis acetyltransferase WcaF